MTTRSGLARVVTALAATVLVAGCTTTVTGTGTPPPRTADLLARTVATMKALPGFAVSTSATIGADTVSSEVRLRGDRGTGTLTRNDATVELRRVGDRVFARAGADFWRGQGLAADAATSLDSRWTTLPGTSSLVSQFVASAYYAPLTGTDFAGAPVRSGTVGGVRVWILDGGVQQAVVSTDAAPRLVQVAFGATGSIDFTYPTDDLQVMAPDDVVPFPA